VARSAWTVISASCAETGSCRAYACVSGVRADYGLWCLNRRRSCIQRPRHAVSSSYSLEDDSMNIPTALHKTACCICLLHAAAVISRMRPAIPPGARIADRLGRRRSPPRNTGCLPGGRRDGGACLKKGKAREQGINTFCINLSFMEPDGETLAEIHLLPGAEEVPGVLSVQFQGRFEIDFE